MAAMGLLLSMVGGAVALPAAHAVPGGTVTGWGGTEHAQSTAPDDLHDAVAVATGGDHSLALRADGTVVAWGDNSLGQTDVPAGLTDVTAISARYSHSLALRADGTVVAWGSNTSGQTDVPAGLTDVTAVAAGDYHSLALKADGTVVMWGDNSHRQADMPAGLTGVVAIAGGFIHSLAVKSDGTVVAWGWNNSGETDVPAGLTDVVAVAGGNNHSLALKADGTVVGWGSNASGQIAAPAGLTDVVMIAAGPAHNLALKADGTVVAWGSNSVGQADVPAGLTDVQAVAAGTRHSLAMAATRATQTISFTTPRSQVEGTRLTLSGTATSALPVTYALDPATSPGACRVNGSRLVLQRPGVCVVAADQAGNATYAAAPTVTRAVTVDHAPELTLDKTHVAREGHVMVAVTHVDAGQKYRIRFLRGRVLAEGTADRSGTIVRRVQVHAHALTGQRTVKVRLFAPRRVLTAGLSVTR